VLTDLNQPDAAGQLKAELEELRARHDIPGIAAGLIRSSGEPVIAAAGFTARGGDQPVGPDTMFSLQSASKMYTAVATMIAVRDGLVDLDAPVTEYLPDFTVNSIFEHHPERRMTLRHLLSHTAGFTHEAPVGDVSVVADGSFPERVASIPGTWLCFPVGERYQYSNLGIDMAGWILAVRSGLTFPAYVQQVLLGPLGLGRTTFDLAAAAADDDRAAGHTPGHSQLPVIHPLVPCGGAFASVVDACRFVQFHLNSCAPLLPAALAEDLYRVPFPVPGQTAGYALGVYDHVAGGRRVRRHSGGIGGSFGYVCDLSWLPEDNLGVVVLTNSTDHPLVPAFAHELFDRLAGAAADPDAAATIPGPWPSTVIRTDLEGEYAGNQDSIVHVSSAGTGLQARFNDSAPVPLAYCGEDAAGLCASTGDQVLRFATNPRRQRVLISVDFGAVWCWNRGPEENPGTDNPASGARTFTVRQWGVPVATTRLWTTNTGTWFGPWPPQEPGSWPAQALRLTEHQPGLFFTSTGEALDLNSSPPTYANIPLYEDEDPPTDSDAG
jgi:CubicO group peptidase (beta-lactamase class C family)